MIDNRNALRVQIRKLLQHILAIETGAGDQQLGTGKLFPPVYLRCKNIISMDADPIRNFEQSTGQQGKAGGCIGKMCLDKPVTTRKDVLRQNNGE